MIELTPEERRHESADHEAGHYVIAFRECLSHPTEHGIQDILPYVTIELGADPRGFGVGGTVATTDYFAPAPEKLSAFILAGIAAQATAIILRNGWREGSDIPLEVMNRVWHNGAGDLEQFKSVFGDEADVLEHLGASCDLVAKHWNLIEVLSTELYERGTLFHDEPALILAAELAGDPQLKEDILELLETYRDHRANITTGNAYESFAARFPGREFKEPLQTLRERKPSIFEVEDEEDDEDEDEEDADEEDEDEEAPIGDAQPRARDIILPIVKDVASAVVGKLAKKLREKVRW